MSPSYANEWATRSIATMMNTNRRATTGWTSQALIVGPAGKENPWHRFLSAYQCSTCAAPALKAKSRPAQHKIGMANYSSETGGVTGALLARSRLRFASAAFRRVC
jgi:hypothetical protein